MRTLPVDRRLAASLFLISGLEAGAFTLRFLRIKEAVPMDNALPIRMQRWADHLWRVDLKAPVYPTQHEGRRGFMVPAEALDRPGAPKTISLTDVPNRTYTLEVTDDIKEITLQRADAAERDLICRMLERPFTDLLIKRQSQFWKAEWTLFFPLRPANAAAARDVLNAYRGFKFGVALVGNAPHLAVDIRTRYIGRRALSDYSAGERDSMLRDHLDLTLREDRRPSFLRDNGSVKIPCRYTGETDQTVAEYEFQPGTTVASYYAARYRLALNPQDPVVFVKDRTSEQTAKPVPASRLFPVFTTESEHIRSCTVKPWMNPEERHRSAASFVRSLVGARLGIHTLVVSPIMFSAPRAVLLPPKLEFGGRHTLDPFHGGVPRIDNEDFDRKVVHWGSSKYPALLQWGPQHNEPLPDLIVVLPDRLPRDVREEFLKGVTGEIFLQTAQRVKLAQHIQYSSGRSEKMGGALLRRISDVKSIPGRCLALIVLCDEFDSSVHGDLKDRIRPLPSQCVTESTVLNIAMKRNPNRAKSQVRNLSLAILTEAGVKPWVLAEPLHYAVYIGIDLLYGRVAYHAFCGTGGRVLIPAFGESQQRGRMQEGIKAPFLSGKVQELLHTVAGEKHDLASIVIHRDGRWWPSEARGLRAAISKLKTEKVLPADVKWAVVEVRKNHMPIRLFTEVTGGATPLLQNPLPGTFLILDDRRVLLTTTGKPGAWDAQGRTAGTLLLQIADSSGDFSLRALAEDAYRLTHLNWTSPDIEISLPVTIRWADEALRETLTVTATEEDGDGQEGLEEEEAGVLEGGGDEV